MGRRRKPDRAGSIRGHLNALAPRLRIWALLAGIALATPACTTLGPDYQEPTTQWLADWQPDLYGQLEEPTSEVESDIARWWARFEDPALNALVVSALQENPGIQAAGLRVLEARAQLSGASALRLPQVQTFDASAAYLRQRRSDGLLPASDDSLGSYSASLGIGWELDFWGRFQRSVEAADAAYLSSIANQRDAQVILVAQVADLYYAYRTTEKRIAIAHENAAIQERSFSITTQLFESGQESELDLQQAKTQYLATLATIPDLERSRTQLRNALAVLLGRPPVPLPELATSLKLLPTVEPASLTAIPANLVLRRPDVRSSAWLTGAQSAQIGIAEADLYPAISLGGSFGWAGDSISATRDGTTFAVGPGIRWNIFDWGLIRSNIRVQDARLQQALAAYDATVLQAAREIDDAAIAVAKTAEAQEILTESREAAERALEIANRRYREGYADFQRVLDAQRALFSQAEKELVNQGAHLSAVVALYKSIGGGWESQSTEQMLPAEVLETMRERTNWGDLLEVEVSVDLENANSEGSNP